MGDKRATTLGCAADFHTRLVRGGSVMEAYKRMGMRENLRRTDKHWNRSSKELDSSSDRVIDSHLPEGVSLASLKIRRGDLR